MRKRHNPVIGERLVIIEESNDHPFKKGEIVIVKEKRWYGVLWVKSEKGVEGCIIPKEYSVLTTYKS